MPRDGIITSISAYFSTTTQLNLGGGLAINIIAQLYESNPPTNTFTAIPGAFVILQPILTGTVLSGTPFHNIHTGLNIPVTAETRLLMVFSANASTRVSVAVDGYASAGVAIE